MFFRFKPRAQWLAGIGAFAYSIYLFHVFVTAGARILARNLTGLNEGWLFLISLTGGLALPILAEHLLNKNKWLKLFSLGIRSTEKIEKPVPFSSSMILPVDKAQQGTAAVAVAHGPHEQSDPLG